MIIIIDTSIWIAALLSPRRNNTREILRLARSKTIKLATTKAIIRELKGAIASDKVKKTPHYRPHIMAGFIPWYQYNSQDYILPALKLPISSRDARDNIFLQLAIVSKANYLITGDKDLLVIKQIGNTLIVTPKKFIHEYNKK